MIGTSLSEFKESAAKYRTVPVTSTIVADTKTPIQLFQLFDKQAAFILESRDALSSWSEYSFIGLYPKYYIVEKQRQFHLETASGQCLITCSTLNEAWEKSMDYMNVAPDLPNIPFPGGAVGYLSFEAYSYYEPKVSGNSTEEPDVHLVFCDTILAFHHEKEEISIIHLQEADGSRPELSFRQGTIKIAEILSVIRYGKTEQRTLSPGSLPEAEDIFNGVTSNYSKEEFLDKAAQIKEYIQAGDIFQAVLSQRFQYNVNSSGLDLYRVLRKVNPSPYLYYLRLGQQEIIGSSPERLIKINDEKELEIHPIAGTRHRGSNEAEDRMLAAELAADEKERAEHLMLVDLARNDAGKVSEYGSVRVEDMMSVAYFSHVMHLITKVFGQLRKGTTPFEAVFAAHPAGTVSGAPKVRAAEIIQDLETSRRGVYAGAVTYCGFNGSVDSCIAIRTIVLKNGTASIQAGAGIVADSVPELEWEETRNKAKALLYAVKIAERRHQLEEVL